MDIGQNRDYIILIMYNQSNVIFCLQHKMKHVYFFKILFNLNLFKIGQHPYSAFIVKRDQLLY
jgi:hypothetical protein